MTIEAGQRLSHYRLIEKIGEGGMGVVWKAEDTVLGRTVAIKVLPADVSRDEKRREMFLQEAQLASQVSAAHIVQVHEFGREGDLDFIVMEYVEGKPLNRLLHGRPLPPHKVADFGHQIAHALSRAHRKNLLHRDLKPANVIVTPDGEVKVLDFGLATLFERSDTVAPSQATTRLGADALRPAGLAGTLPYMSPEQARMEDLDARSDVFSLGTMLYEMTTGQLPFTGPNSVELLQSVQRARPQPVHDLVPQVPLELDRIIQKAMAPRRGDRYQAVEDLAVDLKRLGKELESGSSPSYEALQELADRRTRRLPRWLSMTAGGLAALTVIVVVSWSMFRPGVVSNQPIESLAVLPFENVGGNTDEYLGDGITESLINNLAQLPGLRVLARSTVFRFKGAFLDHSAVGRELNVAAVLTGRIQQREDTVIVSVELVDVADGVQLWGQTYNRRTADVLELQESLARTITEKLRLRLTGEEQERLAKRHTQDAEAYRYYLQGRHHWNKRTQEGLMKALESFNQALDQDPGYALAYAGIAEAYGVLAENGFVSPDVAMPQAKAAALTALDLDETLAEAHASLSLVLGDYDWDWLGAEGALRRALELKPGSARAHHLLGFLLGQMGHHDESVAELKKARELDPLSPRINTNVGYMLYFARRYDEALAELQKAMELFPNRVASHEYVGLIYLERGMIDDAFAELREALRLPGTRPMHKMQLARAYAMSGEPAEARKILAEVEQNSPGEYVSPVWTAWVYVALGEYEHAISLLETGYENRDTNMSNINVDPKLDPLRSLPRFETLLRRMNFPKSS